ncbi:MAG TPA: hypothetical protein VMW32_11360 [Bacteroidales bacterium]|nr:hypothetical protein [Bacteroidales bacterium]
MIRKTLIITVLIFLNLTQANTQGTKQDTELKREVTLYNPYKPSLADVRKLGYLPDMNDTSKVKVSFTYDIESRPFSPVYTISPIKSAALLPDPLTKLYKGFVNIGLGNFGTPLAEISVTNERSKKGAVGFYGRHYSSNGKLQLQNQLRVFAGLMDNEASLFGKKFFRKSFLEGSIDLLQKTRYAYGYSPDVIPYIPDKKDIRLGYYDIGAKASYASLNLDSTNFSYDFDIFYDYFHNAADRLQNHAGFTGTMAKLYQGFYVGSGIELDRYKLSDSLLIKPKFIFSVSPFVGKSTEQWSFNLGLQLLIERNMTTSAKLHLYPDVNFGFSVVPEYIRFFAGLEGRLERNDPLKAIEENPFIIPDGSLFTLPNTDHSLIMSAGLKGNNGIGGNYLASVSYALIDDLLLFSNIVFPDTASRVEKGNYFIPLSDEAELLTIHGEFTGVITNKISFTSAANYYKYTLSANEYAWNKPGWDFNLGLKYNLRNKIIAGATLNALGPRKFMVSQSPTGWMTLTPTVLEKPVHFNLNLSAEYRYTKILSLWARINNISYNRFYEWAYYPSQRFNFMVGFTYSL